MKKDVSILGIYPHIDETALAFIRRNENKLVLVSTHTIETDIKMRDEIRVTDIYQEIRFYIQYYQINHAKVDTVAIQRDFERVTDYTTHSISTVIGAACISSAREHRPCEFFTSTEVEMYNNLNTNASQQDIKKHIEKYFNTDISCNACAKACAIAITCHRFHVPIPGFK